MALPEGEALGYVIARLDAVDPTMVPGIEPRFLESDEPFLFADTPFRVYALPIAVKSFAGISQVPLLIRYSLR